MAGMHTFLYFAAVEAVRMSVTASAAIIIIVIYGYICCTFRYDNGELLQRWSFVGLQLCEISVEWLFMSKIIRILRTYCLFYLLCKVTVVNSYTIQL